MLRWFCLLLPLALSACLGPAPQIAPRSAVTGLAGAASGVAVVTDHPHHVALARVLVVVPSGGPPVHAVQIARAYDGVHPGLRLTSAWTNGRALAYRPAPRGARLCRGTRCDARLIGTIFLTDAERQRAEQIGLQARLLGPDGALDITVPARLFAQTGLRAAAQHLD